MKKNLFFIGLLMVSLSGCDMIQSLTPDLGLNSESKTSSHEESHATHSSSSENTPPTSQESNNSEESFVEESSFTEESFDVSDNRDPDGFVWVIQGDNMLADGTINYWGNKPLNVVNKTTMYRVSLSTVLRLYPSLEADFEGRGVRCIYKFDGLVLGGRTDVEWEETIFGEAAERHINGSHSFKISKVDINDPDELYYPVSWIPDMMNPVTNMTPEIMYSDGMNTGNLIALSSGVYTVIAAKFNGSDYDGEYGVALIKTSNITTA